MPITLRFRDSGNHLLDRLPAAEFDPLERILQRVTVPLKQVVHEYEVDVTHVHFPTTSMISLLIVLEEEDPVEVSTVGREGIVGLVTSLGVIKSPHRAICQVSGDTLRLPVHAFQEALARGLELRRLIYRYTAFSLRSNGQGVACNARHSVEARASRWLLITHDQAGRDEFPMTHEFWAFMLGVRRQTVTVVARALQADGLIHYRRGVIIIRDRARLEKAACECYAVNRACYERIVA
jgi:CRP-like cAMP-binding protein